jgi:Na+-translocating ferredoxin:NAD+ oxidoreductase RnfC subunit
MFLGTEELLKKFMQQNVELQREIEILRAKLEYTFTFVNDKFDEQKSVSTIQTAFEQIRQTEIKLQELKFKSTSQQEENDLLKYLVNI